jgi:AcrR family transcriptional regulator
MARAGLTTESVVAAAARQADERGLEAVTLAGLASSLGVRPPSLYAHVGGLEDLRTRVAARGAEQLAGALQQAAAGLAGSEALSAVAAAYRAYALAHPGAYAALQRAPGRSEASVEAAGRVVAVVLAVLGGYGLEGERALHATRAIRSALHGFVLLETQQGFGLPLDLDESFAALVAVLDRGLREERRPRA